MATQNISVNYLSRDFNAIRADLIDFCKKYHPDALAYFNESSVDMLYLEMVAFVGDMLSYYTDKTFNESFLSTAQAREALVRISNDLGFFEIGETGSRTQVVLSITVPAITVDGVIQPNPDLLIAIASGMQVVSDTGISFEILEEVNFSDSRNRKVIPNLDGNNQIQDYTIEKYVIAFAGVTKIQRFFVSADQAKPFLNISLEDTDVLEVTSVITVPGNIFVAPPNTDFDDPTKQFFEVRSLAEEKRFVEINPIQQPSWSYSDKINPVVVPGQYVEIPKRYILRRDVNNLTTITFGSNQTSYTNFNNLITEPVSDDIVYASILSNTFLGEIPAPNSTIFVRYRVAGGADSNAVTGQINSIGAKSFLPSTGAVDLGLLQAARGSLEVRNDVPALGGKDIPSNEEIRNVAAKIFAAQDRVVTYEDLTALINSMPARFGKPYRFSYEEIKPKVANLSQVKGGVDELLTQLLSQSTVAGRQSKANEILTFLDNLQTGVVTTINGDSILSTETVNTLNLAPTLWVGEKARLYVLGVADEQLVTTLKDTNGNFVSPLTNLKQNMKEFLRQKRVIGDWVDIVDGRVVDIQVEFTILADPKNKQQTLLNCLNRLKDYFNVSNWQMNQPIFISNIITILQEIEGVINVVNLKLYNVFDTYDGREYTVGEIGRYRRNSVTATATNKYEMDSTDSVIVAYNDMCFHVRYKDNDIIGSVI